MELPDNVRLIRDYDPSLPELAHDPDQIEQVLLNIVRNALQALGPEGGEIILRTRTAFQLTLHGERTFKHPTDGTIVIDYPDYPSLHKRHLYFLIGR